MEVHHHAHTSRKRWTHYFWEFLMLFLAVFCGFLAEYQLEHKIEKDREKQYIKSLSEDLESDTSAMNRTIDFAQNQLQRTDSLIQLLSTPELIAAQKNRIYMLHFTTSRSILLFLENRTSQQLKNSGNMRLLRKKNVADSILSYWRTTESLAFISSMVEAAGEKISDLAVRIYDSRLVVFSDQPLHPPQKINEPAIFIDDDPKLITEYYNRQIIKRRRISNFLSRIEIAKKEATDLIILLRNAYHL